MARKRFNFELEMQKVTKEYEDEEAERLRQARLREERSNLRKWYCLIVLLFATAGAIACRERISALVTHAYYSSRGTPASSADAVAKKKERRALIPGVASLDKAKDTIGGAQVVIKTREKLLDDLDPESSSEGAKP
jgi:hypothetical protein